MRRREKRKNCLYNMKMNMKMYMKKKLLFIYYKFMSYTDFNKDLQTGTVGERIFKEDYLNFLGIGFTDVSGIRSFQKKEIDFLVSPTQSYEIKTNLKSYEYLIIEEFHNCDEAYDKIIPGCFMTTQASHMVFINKDDRTMVILKMGPVTLQRYDEKKWGYDLIKNKLSFNPNNPNNNTNKWQSAFRKVKLEDFNGLFSVYQKTK